MDVRARVDALSSKSIMVIRFGSRNIPKRAEKNIGVKLDKETALILIASKSILIQPGVSLNNVFCISLLFFSPNTVLTRYYKERKRKNADFPFSSMFLRLFALSAGMNKKQ